MDATKNPNAESFGPAAHLSASSPQQRFLELPLAALFYLSTLTVVLPLVVLLGFGLSRWAERERADEIGRVSKFAEALANGIDRELRGFIDTAGIIAGSRHLRWGDFKTMDEIARDAATKAGGEITIVNRALEQVVSTRASAGHLRNGSGHPDADARVFETGGPLVGLMSVAGKPDLFEVAIRVPVRVDDDVRYVLTFVPRARAFLDVLQQTILPEGWRAAVIDANGRIVARSERHDEFVGKFASAAFLSQLGSQNGVIESVDLQNRASITSHHRAALTDWRIIVWVPKLILEQPRSEALQLLSMLVVGTLAASLVAAWIVGRRITAPARHLVNVAKALGAGAGVPFAPMIMREANIVGRAMADSARLIAMRQAALSESEARFRNMANYAPVMIWVTEPGGAATFLSVSWYEFTGQRPGSGLGFGWLSSVHPDDRKSVEDAFIEANHIRGNVRIEYRLRRADGVYRWVIDSAQPRFDAKDSFLGYIGSVLDISEVKCAETALRQSENNMRLAMDAGEMGAWIWRISEKSVDFDDKVAQLFDLQQDRWTGRPDEPLDRIVPEDRSIVLSAVDRAIRTRRQLRAEFRIALSNGTIRWIAANGRIEFAPDGRPVIMRGVSYDISLRKEREEQIFLLMREVNHRSKNMLGIVLAVARQTIATDAKDFVARFTERVQALSASQDLLVKNDWRGAEIRDLACSQLAHFEGMIGGRIKLAGPPLRLTPSAAQSIGMALHELATNAGKHGALSNLEGEIELTWKIERGFPDELVMDWVERGGPPVAKPELRGFGSAVIGAMVKMSVGGIVSHEYAEGGVRWHLKCPANAALDRSGRKVMAGAMAAQEE